MRRCIELFWEIEKTIDEDEQIRLMGEIIDLNRKNLWVIGTVGALPSFYLVKNSFRNVPRGGDVRLGISHAREYGC